MQKTTQLLLFIYFFFSFFYFAAFSARDGDPGAIEAGRPCCRAEITLPHLCFFGQPCESNSTLLLSVKWFSLGHSLQKNTLAWKGKENKIAALYFKDSEEPFLNCYFFFPHWSWVCLNPEWTTTFDLPAARRFFGGTCTEQGQNSPRLGAPHNPNFFSIMKRWSLCLSVSLSVSHTPVGMFHKFTLLRFWNKKATGTLKGNYFISYIVT